MINDLLIRPGDPATDRHDDEHEKAGVLTACTLLYDTFSMQFVGIAADCLEPRLLHPLAGIKY